MQRYFINEGSFPIPDEWDDKSVNVFSSSKDLPSEFSVVITRENLDDGEDLPTYSNAQLKELAARLPRFQFITQGTINIDGISALNSEFSWKSETEEMVQRQVFVQYEGKVFTFTATALRSSADKYESLFNQLLAGLRFGRQSESRD